MAGKQKILKGSIVFILLLSLLIQAGCAFKDIDKRVFVLGFGIDPSEQVRNGFRVTLKLAKQVGDIKQSTSPPYLYISHDAESVAEAIHEMETRVDKVLDFGHSKIIVMHKELLTKDLDTFMDFFTRRGDIQMISYVAVADKTAEEIISFEPTTEAPASIALYNYFDNTGTESPFVVTTFLFEFRREVLGEGHDTIMPIIGTDEENHDFVIDKSIVLKRGAPPVELTPEETKYFNSLMNKAYGFSYKIKEDGLIMVLNFDEIRMSYKILLNDGDPRIDMKITKVGVVGESNKRLNSKQIEKYNKIAGKEIGKTVTDLLIKLQENDVNPFGFGLRYRATRLSKKGIMEEWKRIYPDIKFNVKVNIELKSTGAVE
ncbi:Ger(x)C family spore germination protein [Sporosarcina luteola]|uniref:Ger(x)C family spore germination protein n=1 Tax=Sporosarcina luteola TaxID=582850 RepID=UPI00203BD5D9|nr:Ger(x)C family spore germination protein [Sporosarcina luteola]MCM3711448.1 Ger(x)C family spore germination protein [Sporosarcina luteola]